MLGNRAVAKHAQSFHIDREAGITVSDRARSASISTSESARTTEVREHRVQIGQIDLTVFGDVAVRSRLPKVREHEIEVGEIHDLISGRIAGACSQRLRSGPDR